VDLCLGGAALLRAFSEVVFFIFFSGEATVMSVDVSGLVLPRPLVLPHPDLLPPLHLHLTPTSFATNPAHPK
jgi:hypothetical protein